MRELLYQADLSHPYFVRSVGAEFCRFYDS